MNPTELRLLNDFQRDFPLRSAPFATIASALEISEEAVLASLRGFIRSGTVSRVGPAFSPHRIGVSTLAALTAAEDQLATVAALVSSFTEINHNYEREHRFNLWFVVTAPDDQRLTAVLNTITARSGCPVISLPLQEAYHLDLGFDLVHGYRADPGYGNGPHPGRAITLNENEHRLVAALQAGLPLVSRPYATIAEQIGSSERQVIATIGHWLKTSIIRRFGIIVRHHELGFTANAMAVWDVPDESVTHYGHRLAQQPGVNLCYRRRRCLPDWPYNLYCMLHGRDRPEVLDRLAAIHSHCGLARFPHALLFSRRRFKQRGAHYVATGKAA
jgi:DNA-binding Lrp family transcriptional regulator